MTGPVEAFFAVVGAVVLLNAALLTVWVLVGTIHESRIRREQQAAFRSNPIRPPSNWDTALARLTDTTKEH